MRLMGADDLIEVTPTLDTGAYSDGDLLFDSTKVPGACNTESLASILNSLVILDKDDQAAAFDLFFQRSDTSQGSVNSAWSPTDAQSAEIIGRVEIASGDWEDFTNNQIAFKELADDGMGVILKPSIAHTLDIWCFGVARGTPTHTASGLVIKIGLLLP